MIGWIFATLLFVMCLTLASGLRTVVLRARDAEQERNMFATRCETVAEQRETWKELAEASHKEALSLSERNAELKRQLAEDVGELRLSAARYDELAAMFDAWRLEGAVVIEKVPVPVEAVPREPAAAISQQ